MFQGWNEGTQSLEHSRDGMRGTQDLESSREGKDLLSLPQGSERMKDAGEGGWEKVTGDPEGEGAMVCPTWNPGVDSAQLW